MENKNNFFATIDNPICDCHYDNTICFTCEYSSIFCSIKNGCGICSPLVSKPLYKILDIDDDNENLTSSSDDENINIYDINIMLHIFKKNPLEAKKLASMRVREILKNRNYK